MTALARAQADVDRGDLGSGRRRLASYIGSTSCSPDALAMVADISFKMCAPVQQVLIPLATGPGFEARRTSGTRRRTADG